MQCKRSKIRREIHDIIMCVPQRKRMMRINLALNLSDRSDLSDLFDLSDLPDLSDMEQQTTQIEQMKQQLRRVPKN